MKYLNTMADGFSGGLGYAAAVGTFLWVYYLATGENLVTVALAVVRKCAA